METNNFSLLKKIPSSYNVDLNKPYLVIRNALDDNIYNDLVSTFPLDLFANNKENNKRVNYNWNEKNDYIFNDNWKKFMNYNSSNLFYREIVMKFKKSIINLNKKTFNNSKNLSYINELQHKVKTIGQISANTPVIKENSVRDIHLDANNKIFTGLYYFRDKQDDTEGGDLEIYKWKKNYSFRMKKYLIPYKENFDLKHLELVETIKYEKNTFVLLFGSINSLHGVTPRKITDCYRTFCFFGGVVPFKLYDLKVNILFKAYRKLKKYLI